jgi:hypothetical protein
MFAIERQCKADKQWYVSPEPNGELYHYYTREEAEEALKSIRDDDMMTCHSESNYRIVPV